MCDMANRQILPAIAKYSSKLTETALEKKQLCSDLACDYELKTIDALSQYANDLYGNVKTLEADLEKVLKYEDVTSQANAYKDTILPDMEKVREVADKAEVITAKEYWPFPNYTDLLYSIL